eukprot:m.55432 g.55432  ORF g.55432 m.55432 type:complete len:838 (-) comp6929_c1_seq1:40-2553(-)
MQRGAKCRKTAMASKKRLALRFVDGKDEIPARNMTAKELADMLRTRLAPALQLARGEVQLDGCVILQHGRILDGDSVLEEGDVCIVGTRAAKSHKFNFLAQLAELEAQTRSLLSYDLVDEAAAQATQRSELTGFVNRLRELSDDVLKQIACIFQARDFRIETLTQLSSLSSGIYNEIGGEHYDTFFPALGSVNYNTCRSMTVSVHHVIKGQLAQLRSQEHDSQLRQFQADVRKLIQDMITQVRNVESTDVEAVLQAVLGMTEAFREQYGPDFLDEMVKDLGAVVDAYISDKINTPLKRCVEILLKQPVQPSSIGGDPLPAPRPSQVQLGDEEDDEFDDAADLAAFSLSDDEATTISREMPVNDGQSLPIAVTKSDVEESQGEEAPAAVGGASEADLKILRDENDRLRLVSQQLRDDLANLKVQLSQWEDLKQKNTSLEGQLRASQRQISKLEQELLELTSKSNAAVNASSTIRVEQLEAEVRKLQTQMTTAVASTKELKRVLADEQADHKKAQGLFETRDSQVRQLMLENNELRMRVSQFAQAQDSEQALDVLAAENKALQARFAQEKQGLEDSVIEMRQRIQSSETTNLQLKEQVAQLTETEHQLRDELEAARRHAESQEDQVAQLADSELQLRDELVAMRRHAESLEDQVAQLTLSGQQQRDELMALRQRAQSQDADGLVEQILTEQERKHDVLVNDIAAHKWQLAAVYAELTGTHIPEDQLHGMSLDKIMNDTISALQAQSANLTIRNESLVQEIDVAHRNLQELDNIRRSQNAASMERITLEQRAARAEADCQALMQEIADVRAAFEAALNDAAVAAAAVDDSSARPPAAVAE